jgi:hypothetical protein
MTKATIWTKDSIKETGAAAHAAQALGYQIEIKTISRPGPDADAFKAAYPGVQKLPLIVVEGEFSGTLDQFRSANSSKINAKAASSSLAAKKAANVAQKATLDAIAAHREQRVAASKASKTTGTRAERHAAKAADIARNRARLKSLAPAPVTVKDGDREYIQGAPQDAPESHHQARYSEAQARRADAKTAHMAEVADARAAKAAERKAARAQAGRNRRQALGAHH